MDEELVKRVAKAIDEIDGPMGFSYEQFCEAAARAAILIVQEHDAKVAEGTKAYDDNLQKSAGCATTGERIAAAIRGKAFHSQPKE